MADKSAAERTEKPTTKRLSQAKGKGQVAQSQELTSFVLISVLLAMLTFLAPGLMDWFSLQIRDALTCDTRVLADSQAFIGFMNTKIVNSILILCPFFAALCAGAVVAGVAISGFNFSPGALELKFDQLNPIKGFGRLINITSIVKLGLSIAKLLFVGAIVWFYLQGKIELLATLRWAWSVQIIAVIAKIIFGAMIRICIALLLIGVADTFYQKWKYIHDLKMTKQEVKQERKDTEGSPEVKSRIRKIQFEMTLRRMMQEVPKASVVLVNPTHVAVALRYDVKTMESPVVVAKGAEHLAEKIREIARAYGVPIVRKPELARTIYSTVKLGIAIPQTLYVAVAEVLALVYRLRHRKV